MLYGPLFVYTPKTVVNKISFEKIFKYFNNEWHESLNKAMIYLITNITLESGVFFGRNFQSVSHFP